MTSDSTHAVAAPPRFDLQGHRGARGLLPENTIPGFEKALAFGVVTLEMDGVISADRQVVVSHDLHFSAALCTKPDGAPVTEAEEASLRLFAMPYAEIARYDCGRRGHPRFPRQEAQPAVKPLLRDVIAAAEACASAAGRPAPFYNIETKSQPAGDGVLHPAPEAFVRLVLGVVTEAGVARRTIVQSFDPRTLRAARRLAEEGAAPPVRLALLVAEQRSTGLAADLAALGFMPDIYSPDYRLVDAALVEKAHTRRVQVIPWTVNEADDLRRLKKIDVDGLITDYPDLAQQVLL